MYVDQVVHDGHYICLGSPLVLICGAFFLSFYIFVQIIHTNTVQNLCKCVIDHVGRLTFAA